MASDIQIRKIFLHDPSVANTFTDIYVGSPESLERASQTLILIVEYPRTRSAQRSLMDGIFQQAVRAFERSRHATPELTLESVLEALNVALPQLAPSKDPSWLASLNLLVAISDHGQVHFSHIGDIHALLVQNGTLSIVSEDAGSINPLKLFSHVTSGLLEPGATMLVTTTSLLDYLAEDKLRRILSELPPNLAEQKISQLVNQVPASVTFAGVLIKFRTELDGLAERGYEQYREIERPVRQPKNMPETATPAYVPVRTRRLRAGFGPLLAGILIKLARYVGSYLGILWHGIRVSATGLVRGIQLILRPSQRPEKERVFINRTLLATRSSIDQIKRLPRIQRYASAVTLVFVFLLLNLVMLQSQTQFRKTVTTSYDETLKMLAAKKQAVENAMIYDDDAEAERQLMEIAALLSRLSPATKEQEQELGRYREENDRALLKARHINDIPTPLVAAQLTIPESSQATAFAAAPDGSYYVATGADLYSWKDGTLTKRASASSGIVSISNPAAGTLVLTDKGALQRLKGNSFEDIALAKPRDQQTVTAAALYVNNLYLLDAQAGALFKYEGSSTGIFRAGSEWMTNRDLLASSHDLTIDGNVYVVTDTTILKLTRGSRENFTPQPLRPALGTRTRIETTQASNNLYILDPDNKRIIILDKQGKIKDQFTSSQFGDLKDLTITPGETSLAVLNGNTIYLLAINK